MDMLDRWAHLLQWPKSVDYPEMMLIGDDHGQPVVIGYGKLEIIDPQTFTYEMTGRSPDIAKSLRRLNAIRENPYDGRARCRLLLKDSNGLEIAAGWTVPVVEPLPSGEWICRGTVDGLSWIGHATGPAGTELMFHIPLQSRSYLYFARFCASPRRLSLLGTEVEFAFDRATGRLSARANASNDLPVTYSENWIGEPWRIMLGELVYPRLIIRVLQDGRAHVHLRSTPGHTGMSDWIALWRGANALTDVDAFWTMYSNLLQYVASGREFESNKLTQHYEELMQAAEGSRWVWALTLASTVEALVLQVFPRGTKNEAADAGAIVSLSEHIKKWKGDNSLRSTAVQSVKRAGEIAAGKGLVLLQRQGIVKADGVAAWKDIRNSVMHGSLVSRYSDEQEDNKIIALAGLVHSLTRYVIDPDREPISARLETRPASVVLWDIFRSFAALLYRTLCKAK
ncbi:hypothetical protein GOE07_29650 [Sinorhizobium medicae]|nr:hypothetical protein [Sinorhizobium medicae]